MSATLPPLYPIVNVAGGGAADAELAFALASELAEAGAVLLQLRAKLLGAGAFATLARRCVESLPGVRVMVNDRCDVALACGAAGVHLGDEDLSVEAARRLAAAAGRRDFVVGYSTHSPEEAAQASQGGADYLGFGPVFESPTKAGVRTARGLDLLAAACRASRLPVVAIGGITLAEAPACWRAGAASVAVIRELEASSDRRALVASYREAASKAGLAA